MTNIFAKLDSMIQAGQSNIQSYNVRVSSLEEVFNRIGEEEFAETNKVLEDENALDGSKADDIKNTRSSIEAMTSYDSFRALLKYYFMISNSEGTIFSGLVTLGLLTGFLWLLMSPVKF